MARKSLGYVPLVWRCPSCESENPGPIKSCTNCGAPQPPDVKFYLIEKDKFNFIKDEALIKMAKAGPDIHCPYCGTRNLATVKVCTKCGGDLSHGGEVRQSGQEVQVVESFEDIKPGGSQGMDQGQIEKKRISPVFLIIGLLAIIGCIVMMVMLLKTDTVTATVTGVDWERSIVILEYTTVTREDFCDRIPGDVEILSRTQRESVSQTQIPDSTEVCGEDVTFLNQGGGFAEGEVECVYISYDDYCEYRAVELIPITTLRESGTNRNPVWPSVNLQMGQERGQETETYTIYLESDEDDYEYTTESYELFNEAAIGTEWELSINQLGGIQGLEPAN
jgi:hypothetical protein